MDLSFALCSYAMLCVAAIEGFSLFQSQDGPKYFLISAGVSLVLNVIGPWRAEVVRGLLWFLPDGPRVFCNFLFAVLLLEVKTFF